VTASRRAALLASLVLLALAGAAWWARPAVDALAFIARAAAMPGALATLAEWRSVPVTRGPLQEIATRHGAVSARLYRPDGAVRRAVTLVPGVHMDGIDEARLVGMAEDLAASGIAVLTVATPDLQRFRVTPASTDIIEDAALWLAAQPGLASDGRVGMVGISFSGGLSIVAAGRPALRDKVAFVLSFGGHADLPRVMRYLCSGDVPAPTITADTAARVPGADDIVIQPPHDYGLAVVLLNVADRGVVPGDQVAALRSGIGIFLLASSLAAEHPERADQEFARARDYAGMQPEPARTWLGWVNDRAVHELGPRLLPVVSAIGGDPANPALSPERSPPPAAPVFLLHGTGDNVIPSTETVRLADHLLPHTRVRALLSGLITHAEVDRAPSVREVWRLVTFWRELLSR
jgi:dienelactone hydrolase